MPTVTTIVLRQPGLCLVAGSLCLYTHTHINAHSRLRHSGRTTLTWWSCMHMGEGHCPHDIAHLLNPRCACVAPCMTGDHRHKGTCTACGQCMCTKECKHQPEPNRPFQTSQSAPCARHSADPPMQRQSSHTHGICTQHVHGGKDTARHPVSVHVTNTTRLTHSL